MVNNEKYSGCIKNMCRHYFTVNYYGVIIDVFPSKAGLIKIIMKNIYD